MIEAAIGMLDETVERDRAHLCPVSLVSRSDPRDHRKLGFVIGNAPSRPREPGDHDVRRENQGDRARRKPEHERAEPSPPHEEGRFEDAVDDARGVAHDWERRVTSEPRIKIMQTGGFTPLLYAAREGCVECAQILVEAGADLNKADPEGISPLLMAIMNERFDLAAYLIRKGADPNKWDLWGRAPLYQAVDLNTIPRGGRPDQPSPRHHRA